MEQPALLTPNCFGFVHHVEADYDDTVYTITNVNFLENASEEDDNTSFYKLMFVKVLYRKLSKPNENKGCAYTMKGKLQGGNVHCDRMIVGTDISRKAGKNVVTFLLGGGNSRTLFHSEIGHQGDGMICKSPY